MPEFPKATCRICGKQEVKHISAGGAVVHIPSGWDKLEDKTPTRRGPMAEVCSDKCKRALKEENRKANNARIGWQFDKLSVRKEDSLFLLSMIY